MTLAHRAHLRGLAGATAGTMRDRHASTTTIAVGMRTCDRRSCAAAGFRRPVGRIMSEGCPNNPKKRSEYPSKGSECH